MSTPCPRCGAEWGIMQDSLCIDCTALVKIPTEELEAELSRRQEPTQYAQGGFVPMDPTRHAAASMALPPYMGGGSDAP